MLKQIAQSQTWIETKIDQVLPIVLNPLQQMEKRMEDLQQEINRMKADR